mgnify:CR=1 FL=1
MRLGLWFFLRLFIPTAPVLIQYSLSWLGIYKPEFPQITYITMLFSLSLTTVVEYKDIQSALYASIIPALTATFLYTVALLVKGNDEAYFNTLITGFYIWLLLMVFNVSRVILDWRRTRVSVGEQHDN